MSNGLHLVCASIICVCISPVFGLSLKRDIDNDNDNSDSDNPFGSWTCQDPSIASDEWLNGNFRSWPIKEWRHMIANRKASVFYDEENRKQVRIEDSSIPFCQTNGYVNFMKDPVTSSGIAASKAALEKTLRDKGVLPTDGPILMVDVATMGTDDMFRTVSNTLCSVRNVGLERRTVMLVNSGRADYLTSLRSGFPFLTIVEDATHEIFSLSRRISDIGNKWRFLSLWMLTSMGYSVLHIDGDNHLVKNPFQLVNLFGDVDVLTAYEDCLSPNGGFNYWRNSSKSINTLWKVLALPRPFLRDGQHEYGMATGDQSALICAIGDTVVNEGMKHKVALHNEILFHWGAIASFFEEHCYANADNTTFEDYPIAVHTSNAGSWFRSQNLQELGFWLVTTPYPYLTGNGKPIQCKDTYDATEQCKKRMPAERGRLTKYLYRQE